MDFLQKLDYLMNKHDLNKSSLAKACDIPYTTIDNWYKRGYSGLQLPTLKKLSTYFNTTLDYWAHDEITDPTYSKSSEFIIDNYEIDMIKKFRIIDKHAKDLVLTILEKEYIRCVKLHSKEDN